MVVWYYAKGGERRGPMPWSEFRDAARAGAFGPDDLVWTPGYGAEWRKASTLETLFPPPKPAEKKVGWVCKICGYVYEGEELPPDFVCPLCKHGAADFEKLQ